MKTTLTRAAIALGTASALAATALGQAPPPGAAPAARPAAARPAGETLVLGGNIDWIEKSDVTSLREGVIKQIEFQVGDRVEAGQPIGYLHAKSAELAVKKAEVAANSVGSIERAKAQLDVALSKVAMLENLQRGNRANVPPEEMRNAKAEAMIANAMVTEAKENQALAQAELAIARQIHEEHTIYAPPFTGYVTERMKGPNESVRASDAVLRIGRTDKLRFFGYLPLESASRVRPGDLVEVRPVIDDNESPIEGRVFRGKVVNTSQEVSTVNRTELQVLAEIDNPEVDDSALRLKAGMKGEMTIFLGAPAPAVGAARRAAAPLNAAVGAAR
jgi:multidrug efflux pump subunit AcrA (membrane-fusion protein)